MLSVEEALERIAETVTPAPAVSRPLDQTLGLSLAEPIVSTVDSPPFDKSMMDGYAVRSTECVVGADLEVIGELMAGHTAEQEVHAGQSIRIMTGAPIPVGADAVVPVELTQFQESTNRVRIQTDEPVLPGQNIILRGHSIQKGETILKSGSCLRAQEIAVLAELGHSKVLGRPKPSVAVLATGDELVPYNTTPGPGQIRNSNVLMLMMQTLQADADVVSSGLAKDDRDDLRKKIQFGLQADFLCLSGGVSAGKLDLVPSVLQALGVTQIFHKVAVKPGKPIWFGIRPATAELKPCYVFGLPGNPVSSMVCFELFVRHALRCFSGMLIPSALIQAILTEEFSYNTTRETYFPAKVVPDNGQLTVTPVDWKGSSDLRSTVEANASLRIPIGNTLWHAGTTMDVLPWGQRQ